MAKAKAGYRSNWIGRHNKNVNNVEFNNTKVDKEQYSESAKSKGSAIGHKESGDATGFQVYIMIRQSTAVGYTTV